MEKRSVIAQAYRNYVELTAINRRVKDDPKGFVEASEALYAQELLDTAEQIAAAPSKIVLLSGPSSSGKTTTTKRLCQALQTLGIRAHHVEMDHYFLDVDRNDHTLDLESPERMDMTLLHEHLEMLERGEEIEIPHFEFSTGKREGISSTLKLQKDEIAVFEGIHALNEALYTHASTQPVGVYLSARMRVTENAQVIIEPEWTRFARRCIRDELFRGTDYARTQRLWPNVRRGEVCYIMPDKHRAQLMIDTSLDYELSVLGPRLLANREKLSQTALEEQGMGTLLETLARFEPLNTSYVPEHSLLREFIGK